MALENKYKPSKENRLVIDKYLELRKDNGKENVIFVYF